MLEVKIKQLSPESAIPTYAKDGDARMDLRGNIRLTTY